MQSPARERGFFIGCMTLYHTKQVSDPHQKRIARSQYDRLLN